MYQKVNREFGMVERSGDVDGLVKLVRQSILYMGAVGLFPELHRFFVWCNKIRGVRHAGTVLVEIATANVKDALVGNVPKGDGSKSDPFLSKISRMLQSGQINATDATDSIGSNIGAGSDTTGITLSAAFYHIYRNPRILAKLRAEIDGRPDPLSFNEAQRMTYLQAIINETLRIHPAVGYILRREVPDEGAILASRHFPSGVGSSSKEILGTGVC